MFEKYHKEIGIGLIILSFVVNFISIFYLPKEIIVHLSTQNNDPTFINTLLSLIVLTIGETLICFYLVFSKKFEIIFFVIGLITLIVINLLLVSYNLNS